MPRDKDSNTPDLATPINSQGGYGNAMGGFSTDRSLSRKVKSRKDLAQPAGQPYNEGDPNQNGTNAPNGSIDRYFGSFSLESKRHVWDLLKKHPQFGDEAGVRMNRIRNNTREVLPNDPFRNVTNGGYVVYEDPESH